MLAFVSSYQEVEVLEIPYTMPSDETVTLESADVDTMSK